MSKNNNEYRLTLKFKEGDPIQKEVIGILKGMGRKKSKFISSAVKFYLDNDMKIPSDKAALQDIVKEIIFDLLKTKVALAITPPVKNDEIAVNEPIMDSPPIATDKPPINVNKPKQPKPSKQSKQSKPLPHENTKKEDSKKDDYSIDDDDLDFIMSGLASFGYDAKK